MAERRSPAALALALAAALACGGERPTTPPAPLPSPTVLPTTGPRATVTGEARAVLGGAPVSGATVSVAGATATTDAAGRFTLEQPAGAQACEVVAPGTLTRRTTLTAPGPHAVLTLIPSAFDLTSFDQLARGGGPALRRWTSAPALVVVDRVLTFTSTSAVSYTAAEDELTAGEAGELAAQLGAGLEALTSGRLQFRSVDVERVAPGAAVGVRREGVIVAARYRGLTAATGFWGYGRWATTAAGDVNAGIVQLDLDFERSGSPFRESLRVHELGHALGYDHVTSRVSVMNSNARNLPTDWDREAATVAFARPPRNATPDTDPTGASVNTGGGAPQWHAPRSPCGALP